MPAVSAPPSAAPIEVEIELQSPGVKSFATIALTPSTVAFSSADAPAAIVVMTVGSVNIPTSTAPAVATATAPTPFTRSATPFFILPPLALHSLM